MESILLRLENCLLWFSKIISLVIFNHNTLGLSFFFPFRTLFKKTVPEQPVKTFSKAEEKLNKDGKKKVKMRTIKILFGRKTGKYKMYWRLQNWSNEGRETKKQEEGSKITSLRKQQTKKLTNKLQNYAKSLKKKHRRVDSSACQNSTVNVKNPSIKNTASNNGNCYTNNFDLFIICSGKTTHYNYNRCVPIVHNTESSNYLSANENKFVDVSNKKEVLSYTSDVVTIAEENQVPLKYCSRNTHDFPSNLAQPIALQSLEELFEENSCLDIDQLRSEDLGDVKISESTELISINRSNMLTVTTVSSESSRPAETFNYELVRLSSFQNFPSNINVFSIPLARAGFYYTGKAGECQSFCCGKVYKEWKYGDDPYLIHQQISPTCFFLTERESGNVPIHKEDRITPRHYVDQGQVSVSAPLNSARAEAEAVITTGYTAAQRTNGQRMLLPRETSMIIGMSEKHTFYPADSNVSSVDSDLCDPQIESKGSKFKPGGDDSDISSTNLLIKNNVEERKDRKKVLKKVEEKCTTNYSGKCTTEESTEQEKDISESKEEGKKEKGNQKSTRMLHSPTKKQHKVQEKLQVKERNEREKESDIDEKSYIAAQGPSSWTMLILRETGNKVSDRQEDVTSYSLIMRSSEKHSLIMRSSEKHSLIMRSSEKHTFSPADNNVSSVESDLCDPQLESKSSKFKPGGDESYISSTNLLMKNNVAEMKDSEKVLKQVEEKITNYSEKLTAEESTQQEKDISESKEEGKKKKGNQKLTRMLHSHTKKQHNVQEKLKEKERNAKKDEVKQILLHIQEQKIAVVFLLLCSRLIWTSASAEISWEVQSQPAVFGENVTLYCNTSSVQNSCEQCKSRWYGGKNIVLLSFNGLTVNHSKYETTHDSNGFSLIIKHFDESDVNELYSCTFGFFSDKKKLQLTNDFEMRPVNETTDIMHNVSSSFLLNIQVVFKKVHPLPRCIIFLNGDNLLSKLIMNHQQEGLFYRVTMDFQHNLKPNHCTGKIELECTIGTRNLTVFSSNLTSLYSDNCKNEQSQHSTIEIVGVVTLSVVIITVTVAAVLISLRGKKTLANDSEESDEMTSFSVDQPTIDKEELSINNTHLSLELENL